MNLLRSGRTSETPKHRFDCFDKLISAGACNESLYLDKTVRLPTTNQEARSGGNPQGLCASGVQRNLRLTPIGVYAGRERSTIYPSSNRMFNQGCFRQGGTLSKKAIVHLPEPPGLTRAVGGLCGGARPFVDLIQWKVSEDELSLA